MIFTVELLMQCTDAAVPVSVARSYLPFVVATMEEFEIDRTLSRRAAFLAQVGHESEGLKWMREIWGPTDAQKRYEPPSDLAARLGNTMPGDGRRFAGRGPIQITGRFNYLKIGEFMGLNLIEHPEQLELPAQAWRSAGAFWKWKGLNAFVDADDFLGLTKRINGGTNGLADRLERWKHAKAALGIV